MITEKMVENSNVTYKTKKYKNQLFFLCHFVSIHKRRLAYLNNLEKNMNGCPKLLHNSYQNLLTWYSVDGAEGSENTNGTNSTQVFSFVVKQFERSYKERKLMA